jgi:hypothetical protein
MSRKTKIVIAVSVIACVLVVLAIPNFIHVPSRAQGNFCINNLRMIDSAKKQWALENNKTNGDVTWKDLRPYIGHGPELQMPECPGGGVYIVGKLGELPKCSIGGPDHALPSN